MVKYWGYHYTLNCSNCNDQIKSKEAIVAFAKQLVDEIEMVAYGEPDVPYFALHDPTKGGHSLNQFIETSNITGHFVDSLNEMYLDVFSCMPFDEKKVLACVKQHFGEDLKYNDQMLLRKAP